MAGWDGDDLAGRVEDANERALQNYEHEEQQRTLTSVERTRLAKLESLRLSQARTLEQLQSATNPSYRHTLERGLNAIEAEMASLAVDEKL